MADRSARADTSVHAQHADAMVDCVSDDDVALAIECDVIVAVEACLEKWNVVDECTITIVPD